MFVVDPDELARFPVFARLTANQRTDVAAIAQDCRYPDGGTLFRAGDTATGCWVIRSGQVTLGLSTPGRGQLVIETLHEPDVVGWSWLVPPYRWTFTSTAAGPVEAIEFDAVRLRGLTRADPTLCCALLFGLFEAVLPRLQGTRARLLDLYGSPRDR